MLRQVSSTTSSQSNLRKQHIGPILTSQIVLNSPMTTMSQLSEASTSTALSAVTLPSALVYNKPMPQQPYQVKYFFENKL